VIYQTIHCVTPSLEVEYHEVEYLRRRHHYRSWLVHLSRCHDSTEEKEEDHAPSEVPVSTTVSTFPPVPELTHVLCCSDNYLVSGANQGGAEDQLENGESRFATSPSYPPAGMPFVTLISVRRS